MRTQQISRKRAIDLINGVADGKIFSVLVKTRATGEIKRIACRKSVRKGVTGHGAKYDPTKKGLITVYKMAGSKSGFRCIATEGLRQVIIGGQVYTVR